MPYRDLLLSIVIYAFLASETLMAEEKSAAQVLPEPSTIASTLTFDELKRGLSKRYDEAWAIEIDYTQLADAVALPLVDIHFAMKGEKRFKDEHPENANTYGEAYDGTDAQIFHRDASGTDAKLRNMIINPQKQAWVDIDPYVSALGLPISDRERAQNDTLILSLNDAKLLWEVHPTLDVIDGANCHVLESKTSRTRLWIDPQLSYAIRFVELLQSTSSIPKAEWPLMMRTHYSDFEQTPQGIALPKLIQTVMYVNYLSPREMWNKPKVNQTLKVKKLLIGNDVKDSVFRFDLVPGTTINDKVRNEYYRIGNSGEKQNFAAAKSNVELGELKKQPRRMNTILLVNAVIMAICAVAFAASRFRRSKQSR